MGDLHLEEGFAASASSRHMRFGDGIYGGYDVYVRRIAGYPNHR